MKNTNFITLLILSLFFASCSEKIPYENQVIEHLRKKMKNPDSFRLDSINYDPIFLSEKLDIEIFLDSLSIASKNDTKAYLQESIELFKNDPYMVNFVRQRKWQLLEIQYKIETIENHKEKNQKLLSEILDTEKDTVFIHTYEVYYMGQNSFGAMIKGYSYFETTDGKNIKISRLNSRDFYYQETDATIEINSIDTLSIPARVNWLLRRP